MCNMAGQALRKWSMKARVNDVVITADSQVIVCITADKSIELMRLNDHVPVSTLGLMCIAFAFKIHCIHAFRSSRAARFPSTRQHLEIHKRTFNAQEQVESSLLIPARSNLRISALQGFTETAPSHYEEKLRACMRSSSYRWQA